jgi:hypothetical protein
MVEERIRIEFERSGGFGGLVTRRTVDTATLPPDAAVALRALLEAADIDAVRPGGGLPVPDAYQYRLVVQRGAGRSELTISDPEVPATLRPLLRYLATAGRDEGRGPPDAGPRP